ncbi:helical backbone metal receptor [Sporosarcina pasteurii]|uniref:Vitamin B12-binding protein n=1 Tax=Sporosarcina pasteurii TaxID=1474 RepID=A0A380BKC5_SPOPA|nr:helical backbone metal receptor [Sporosarcina pasteurii]MDS9470757.1 helical backbone metal receptor [Sporosarcina pasteurii]SUJ01904.1 Vitamin B12-binding protein precursor [Sporosarcina pasteurii]
MLEVIDHLGRKVQIARSPKRIISLCPAITATLFSLGLENEIVGRTRYCIHPKNKVEKAAIVGGTKEINLKKIRDLQPDLIIAEKEENTKEIVQQLEHEFPVYVCEVQSIEENDRMIRDIGSITNSQHEATSLIQRIKDAFANLPNLHGKRVAYVIWKDPYMVVGHSTYIQSVLEAMNAVNPFTKFESRYPIVSFKDIQRAKLDYLFLATEPYTFTEACHGI